MMEKLNKILFKTLSSVSFTVVRKTIPLLKIPGMEDTLVN